MRTSGFILRENKKIPYYSCRAFESLPWLRHGFSTRRGGVDGGTLNLNFTAWDTPERVNENRRRLFSALGLEDATLISLKQIHSDRVYAVESDAGCFPRWTWKTQRSFTLFPSSGLTGSIDNRRSEASSREGDALITNVENAALAIKVADCFPVLIVDPIHRAIGAVHSGWRGTLARVLPRTIEEMSRRFQSDPARLLFALGPGIRECCFEVAEDVASLFTEAYSEIAAVRQHPLAPGKYLVNLAAVLKTQMRQAGAPPENQYDLEICTRCNTEEFFSWRAAGPSAGRMMAVISILST
jgi:YfiH family protein